MLDWLERHIAVAWIVVIVLWMLAVIRTIR